MSLRPPPKMLSRLRDEEGRAYHDATMQKRRADAMWIARLKEMARIAKMRGGMAEPRPWARHQRDEHGAELSAGDSHDADDRGRVHGGQMSRAIMRAGGSS